MSPSPVLDASANTDRFYTVIKSMHQFNKSEVKAVIDTLVPPIGPHEQCLIGTYYRMLGNIETLLLLQNSIHFQAIPMLARSLFELAVDMRLLEIIPDATGKMLAYSDVEKLRAAEKLIAFKVANPLADVDTAEQDAFVARDSVRVAGLTNTFWPGKRKPEHWSGLKLGDRVKKLGVPFEQIYAADYPRFSWYVHPGLTGVANMPSAGLVHLCGYAFHMASIAYGEALSIVIREFKISKANKKIDACLKLARMLPFTNNREQAEALTNFLLTDS